MNLWKNRAAHTLGCYLGVCATKEEHAAVYNYLGTAPKVSWDNTYASVAELTKDNEDTCAVVSINLKKFTDPAELVRSIVHEAVHVWQMHCRVIDEKEPSKEYEAYTVEQIFSVILEHIGPAWTKELKSRQKSPRGSKTSTNDRKRSTGKSRNTR